MGKGEIAQNEQFLLFPQCFLPVFENFVPFPSNSKCRLQKISVWKSLKFVVWERAKLRYKFPVDSKTQNNCCKHVFESYVKGKITPNLKVCIEDQTPRSAQSDLDLQSQQNDF